MCSSKIVFFWFFYFHRDIKLVVVSGGIAVAARETGEPTPFMTGEPLLLVVVLLLTKHADVFVEEHDDNDDDDEVRSDVAVADEGDGV